MSVIKRKPFIEKVLASMSATDVNELKNQLNVSANNIDNKVISAIPVGVNTYVLKLGEFLVLPCICVRNADYTIALNYGDNQSVNIYNLNVTTGSYTKIKEYLTISELRRVCFERLGGGGGSQIIRLYNDTGTAFTSSTEVQAFVTRVAPQYSEKEYGSIIVVDTDDTTWKFDGVSHTWKHAGTDIVSPFTNLEGGTIRGKEDDGYVEHLVGDPDGAGHVHGWDNKLDKLTTTSGLKAYIRNGSTDTSMDLVQTNTTGNTIPVRTSTGTIRVGDAVDDKDAVNKGQLDKYLPLDGSKAMTGNIDMDNHIINMKGAKIANLGAGGDDDAISKGKAKELFVNKQTTTDNKKYAYGFDKNGEKVLDFDSKVNYTDIVDSVVSADLTKAASAKTAKDLSERIDALSAAGRYLSGWNCSTGKPDTNPGALPYTYKSGDYYIITAVSATTNYKPSGATYSGAASTILETGTPHLNDFYRYDGTNWTLTTAAATTVEFANVGGDPMTNAPLASILNAKAVKENGSLTGNTSAENITVTGDTTLDDLAVNGDATFAKPVEVVTPTSNNHAATKKYVDDRLLEIDGATIIKGDDNKIKTSLGAYEIDKLHNIINGVKDATRLQDNYYLFESNEEFELTSFGGGDYLKGTLTISGSDVSFEGEVTDIEVEVPGDTYIFPGVTMTKDPVSGASIYLGYDEGQTKFILAASEGDLSTILTGLNIVCKLKEHLIQQIANKFLLIDNNTIKANDSGYLEANISLDEETIVKNLDGKLETTVGGKENIVDKTLISVLKDGAVLDPNIHEIRDGATHDVDSFKLEQEIFGTVQYDGGEIVDIDTVAEEFTFTGQTSGTEYTFPAILLKDSVGAIGDIYLGYYNGNLVLATNTGDLSTVVDKLTLDLKVKDNNVTYIKHRFIPFDKKTIVLDGASEMSVNVASETEVDNYLKGKIVEVEGDIVNGTFKGPEEAIKGQTIVCRIVPSPSHTYPEQASITITNATIATGSYNKGRFELLNITGNIKVSVTCPSE